MAGSTKHATLTKDEGLYDTASPGGQAVYDSAAEGMGYMHINPSGAYDYAAGASAGAADFSVMTAEDVEGMYATIEPALPDDE